MAGWHAPMTRWGFAGAASPPRHHHGPPGAGRSTVYFVQTFDDVTCLAAGLPEVTEGVDKHRKTYRTWEVSGKAFA
jgi:hypothetical protein